MVRCACGRLAVVKTCWNNVNADRRYYACPIQGSRCPINGWLDPPQTTRAREVFLYLQRHIDRNEAVLQECQQALISKTMDTIDAVARANELEATQADTLAELLLEKEKLCRLRNFCVFSWILIIAVCIWYI